MNHFILIAITVLTWNTARMDYAHKPGENKVLQFLAEQDADVVCLQEVDVYKNSKFLTLEDVKHEMRKKYPYSYIDFSTYDYVIDAVDTVTAKISIIMACHEAGTRIISCMGAGN